MNNILRDSNMLPIIRLVIGIGLGIYGFVSKDYLFIPLGGLFMMQGILNLSCCGIGGCNTTSSSSTKNSVYGEHIKEYNSNKK